MTTFAWPAILKPRDLGWGQDTPSRTGGQSTVGSEQTVVSGSGRWTATVTLALRNDDQVLAARGLLWQLEGTANDVLVPAFDARRASWPTDAQGRVLHPGFTRRPPIDGTAYEDPAIPAASAILVTVNSSAARRARSMTMLVGQGGAPRVGQHFGIGQRLYGITSVAMAGSVATVGFWPELRAAAVPGTDILFTRPVCRMRLADPDDGRLVLKHLRTGPLTLDFIERF